ncbi:hypothetical protein COOONC_23915 [Cooperia oncophora]
MLCGYTRNYEWNTDHLSRNERYWREQSNDYLERDVGRSVYLGSNLRLRTYLRMSVEAVSEQLQDISLNTFRTGVAAVKAEFLITKDNDVKLANNDSENGEETPPSNLPATNVGDDRRSKKGMNKHRMKEMKQAETVIRASNARLCPSVIQPVKCKFGEKCSLMHDIPAFLARKPADIGEVCPLFEARGVCPFSYACRFGGAHVDPDGKQISKEPPVPYEETINSSSIHIQIALRKRTFDFSRSDKVVQAVKEGLVGSMEREKPALDMKSLKGKKYLAPLTTVGNLPFRRLCVSLGADITCGEMAMATSLLSGTPSEYSLAKRHPSEKIFGVQLAGGFADSMAKAAQILVDEMKRLEEYPIGGIMIGRGALIKPWIFTEIDERRTWDISASERLDLLKQ